MTWIDDERFDHWCPEEDGDYWFSQQEDWDGPARSTPWSEWTVKQKKAYWEKKNREIALRVFCKPVKHNESPILQSEDAVSIWDSAFGRAKTSPGRVAYGERDGASTPRVVEQQIRVCTATEKRLTLFNKFLASLSSLVRRCGFLAEAKTQTNTKERQSMNKSLLSLGLLAIAGGITQIANGIVDDTTAASSAAPAPTPRKKKEDAPAPTPTPTPAAPSAITAEAAKAELAKVSSTVNVDAAKAILRKLLPNEEKPKFSTLTADQYPALLKLTAEALGTGAADEEEDPLG